MAQQELSAGTRSEGRRLRDAVAYFLLMSAYDDCVGDIISCLITISRRRPSDRDQEGHARRTHTCESHMLTRRRARPRRCSAASHGLDPAPQSASAAYLVAHPYPSVPSSPVSFCPSLRLPDWLYHNKFLDFVFLIVNTLFPRLFLSLSLSVCFVWPLVQTAMICQSPCGSLLFAIHASPMFS